MVIGYMEMGTRKRAGANLSIGSNPGAGTEIDLAIPAAVVYPVADAGEGRNWRWGLSRAPTRRNGIRPPMGRDTATTQYSFPCALGEFFHCCN